MSSGICTLLYSSYTNANAYKRNRARCLSNIKILEISTSWLVCNKLYSFIHFSRQCLWAHIRITSLIVKYMKGGDLHFINKICSLLTYVYVYTYIRDVCVCVLSSFPRSHLGVSLHCLHWKNASSYRVRYAATTQVFCLIFYGLVYRGTYWPSTLLCSWFLSL